MKKIWGLFFTASTLIFVSCSGQPHVSSSKTANNAPETDPTLTIGNTTLTIGNTTLTIGNTTLKLSEIKSRFKIETVAVPEPHHQGLIELKAFRVIPFFDAVLGKDWRKKDAILYTCSDGFKSDIPVAKILSGNPLLAISFADETKPFTAINKLQGGEKVNLGPYYLIWEVQKHPELKVDSAYIWPYQIEKLDTIQYAVQYASLLPFKKITITQREGFEYFKNFCMECHFVGGQGGLKGPALWPNADVIKKGYAPFEKWVLDPQSVKPGTTMAALNPELSPEKRKAVAKKIFAYLSALNKVKPPEAKQ